MGSFVEDYLEYFDPQESPKSFHAWTALGLISCTLGRRVFYDRKLYRLYPNQYIILVAGSALCRKSAALDCGMNLFRKAGLDKQCVMIREKSTPEKLIADMAEGATATVEEDVVSLSSKTCVAYADELNVFLSYSAITMGMANILNRLYTCPDSFTYGTKGSGTYDIPEPCLNMLAATTVDWIARNLDVNTVTEGLFGRIVWVFEPERDHPNALLEDSTFSNDLYDSLVSRLHIYSCLNGPMTMTIEAKKLYSEWYDAIAEPEDHRLGGFVGRQHEHAIKVAMILSIASNHFPIIHPQHITAAISLINRIRIGLPDILIENADNDDIRLRALILKAIQDKGEISHSILLRRMWHRMRNKTDFKEAIDTCKQAGWIKEEVKGKSIVYKYVKGA